MSKYTALGLSYDPNKKNRQTEIKYKRVDPFLRSTNEIPKTDLNINKSVFKLTQWQQEFKYRILNQQDTIVNVPPAAGKTAPILEAWSEIFKIAIQKKDNFTSTLFPRLLFVVPTRQLSIQTYASVLKSFQTGLIQIYVSLLPEKIQNQPLTQNLRKQAYIWANEIITFITGNIPVSTIKSNIYNIKPIIIATYEKAQQIIKSHNNKFHTVIIDELQEFMPKPNRNFMDLDTQQRAVSFFNIVQNTYLNSGLHLLTGSINIKSTNSLIDFLNTKYKRKFKLITLGQHDVGNRSRIFLHPLEKIKNLDYQKKLIINAVKNKKTNNALILFSIKRSSALGIFRIIEDILPHLPKRNPESLYDKKIYKIQKQNSLKTRKAISKDLPGIEDKDYIEKSFEKSQRHPLPESLPLYSAQRELNVDDIEFLKYFDIDAVENKRNSILKRPDENNILYQSILGGVGVLVGQMGENFKIIVQKLFMSGKIYFLLATNSLGVGANIKAQSLYIPSLLKFEGTDFQDLDSSTIVQLVNRAGRGAFPTANIYVSVDDYLTVKNLLQQAPSIGIEEIEDAQFQEFKNLSQKNFTIKQIFYNLLH